ncbi:MAG: TonB-dependent receptor, partial [Acidobacteriaceae bacterium]|nr:TonB-dependent receptor [Acidobacteriaceae bacterium]
MPTLKLLFGILLVFAVFTLYQAHSQTAETGAISGTISDSSGAVLSGASVRITNVATGETRQAASQDNGRYTVPLVPPGTYTVEVAKSGFTTALNSGMRVDVAEVARLDVVMKVGEVVEKINVEASPTLVQTESSTVGRVVDEEAMENLPLVTRNYTQVIGLSPGIDSQVTNASELGRGSGGVSPTQSTAGTFVHGARSYDNNYQMNGISVNDNEGTGGSSGGVPIPNADTIQEFKVQTGLYDAGFGHNAGANVDIITKGGGNQFHGSLFEFFRNEDLNANNFFFNRAGQPRGVLRQNQFGFTLGGPIIKDKLLFFGSYQGTRQLNGASTAINTTCAATLIEPPLTNDRSASALGALFSGQTGAQGGTAIAADGSNINPSALALLNLKLPNGSFLIPTPQVVNQSMPFASQGFSAFSEPCRYNEDQFMINSDYLQSSKSHFSERFFFVNGTQNISFPVGTFVPPGNVPGFPSGVINNSRTFSLEHTYAFSSRWLNVARFGFNHLLGSLAPHSPYKFSDVGISEAAQNNDLPSITIAGSINMGPSGPLEFTQNTYSFDDSLSYAHGRHSIRFGGGISRLGNDLSNILTGGDLQFLSFPDFLLGESAAQNGTTVSNVFASLDALGEFDRKYRAWEWNLFFQDDLRITKTLTLNLGLRFERLGLYGDNLGRNANFDPTKANPNPPAAGTIQGYLVDS